MHRAAEICKKVQNVTGKKLVDFKEGLESSEDIAALKKEVETFAAAFPMPGFETQGL